MRHTCLAERADHAASAIQRIPAARVEGRVSGLSGLSVEVTGLGGQVSVGDRLDLATRSGCSVPAEIVGFAHGAAQAMAFGPLDGLGPGSAARASVRLAGPALAGARNGAALAVADGWLGRVVDPLGRPLDGRGPLPAGVSRPVRAPAPPAATRARLGPRFDLGVRSLDCFAACRQGQRLGLFAGSGIGKSTLLGMLARQSACDVAVLALVGERGREVREFMEDELKEGLARAVVVVATSDTPPLMRREAAYAAMTVAEHFRDQGASVLLLMDSVTRFCLALREIGLSVGEPPATRGFPPSVFAELPRLLERAGPGLDNTGRAAGAVTGLFTVLVEGDDHNEPIADAVRGILDGHVVLDRRIAEAGRYPAVDVLRSLSRAAHGVLSAEEAALVRRVRAILALHADMGDLIRLGAYRPGADAAVDEAVALAPRIEAVLRQDRAEASTAAEAFAQLAQAVNARGS